MLDGARGGWRRRIASRGSTLVPEGGRHATVTSLAVVEITVTALSDLRRAGGDRDLARSKARRAGDRPPAGARAVHDLSRAAPLRAAAVWSIGPPPRNGTPTDPPAVQNRPSWRSTGRCGVTCRTGWPGLSSRRAGRRCAGQS